MDPPLVAGRHPLKQGLKLDPPLPCLTLPDVVVAGRHPLKQGLKLDNLDIEVAEDMLSQGGIH